MTDVDRVVRSGAFWRDLVMAVPWLRWITMPILKRRIATLERHLREAEAEAAIAARTAGLSPELRDNWLQAEEGLGASWLEARIRLKWFIGRLRGQGK